MNKSFRLALAALPLALVASNASAIEIELINLDIGTGIGLDDPSTRSPVGANPGVTLGEQRRIAYQYAADMWSAVLGGGDVPVRITATFQPLACTPTGATLASAGATSVFRDFGAVPGTWYAVALTKGITGIDVNAPAGNDITTRFNGAIGVDPNCLIGQDWYYGLDGLTPTGTINFLNVVMHEMGHGLGVQGFESINTGAFLSGFPSIYGRLAADNTVGATTSIADLASNAARFAAFRRDGSLVWTGPNVTAEAPLVLGNRVDLNVISPAGAAGLYEFFPGSIGPAATAANFTDDVAVANDGTATPTLGCAPFVNAADVSGRIALVDRGVCTFSVKALNAQAAGATGVLIGNNAGGSLTPGGDGTGINIPVAGVLQATSTLLKANAVGLAVTLTVNPAQLAGADAAGRAQLYAPTTAAAGSTYSHYDTRHSPNALMEPFNTASVQANYNVDLTPALFADEGWPINYGGAQIGGCDTTIAVTQPGGDVIGASVQARSALCAADAGNKGQYQSCIVRFGNELVGLGLISGNQKGRLSSCAAKFSP
jgi:PA domain